MEQYLQPIRVKNAKGDGFVPVDTTLVEADGVVGPKAAKGDLTLSAGGDTAVIKSKGAGAVTRIDAPGKLSAPTLNGSTATYSSAYGKGIDLVVTATPAGFRQQIVIRRRPADPVTFRVPVDLPKGLSFGENAKGAPTLKGGDGTRPVDIRPALLLDAVAADPNGDLDTARVGRAAVSLDGSALVYTPDPAFLADQATSYPVTMAVVDDDWFECTLGNCPAGTGESMDTFVNDVDLTDSWDNFQLDRILVGKSNTGTKRWRSYIQFPMPPQGDLFWGSTIQNADLELWNYLSNACGEVVGSGVTARRITSDWDELTLLWSTQPTVTNVGADTEYGAYSTDCAGGMNYAHDLIHSVNGIVQAWADGEPNYGIQLRAGNESDLTNWRRYRTREQTDGGLAHGPRLTVDFEPPAPPRRETVVISAPEPLTSFPEYDEAVAKSMYVPDAPVAPSSLVMSEETVSAAWMHRDGQPYLVGTDMLDSVEASPSGPDTTSPDEEDTLAPRVLVAEPASDATEVALDAKVRVTFTEPIDEAELSVKTSHGTVIEGTITRDAAQKVVTFTPQQALSPGTTYTVDVSGAIDEWENAMDPYSWSFRTVEGVAAHWTFDEGTGNTAADSAGDHDATLNDRAAWGPGKSGNAVSSTDGPAAGSPVSGMTFEDHSDDGYVLFTGADGSQLTYTRQADGTYERESDPADTSKVVKDSPTQFTHTAADGVRTVFTAVTAPVAAPAHLFADTATPAVAAVEESDSLELGVKFTVDQPGLVTGVRFYKGPGNTGTHIGNLWTTAGQKLATGTFTGETESGWQTLTFAAPVQVVPDTTYVASYFAPSGHYSFNDDFFSSATDSPPLHAPATTEVYGGNGVYAYGASSLMPSGSFHGGNYWVDVEFVLNQGQPDPALSGVSTKHLFGATATPGTGASTDPDPLELGVKFTADQPGFVTGVRFYKGPGNTGAHIGNLWTASGVKLATGTFTGETESGWQTLTFAAPVQVTSGTTYVASYYAPAGRYAFDAGHFATATDNPPLHAPATTEVYGGNGVYGYGPASQFPTSTYGGGNYWVDVNFASNLARWVVGAVHPAEEPLAKTVGPVLRTDESLTVSAWLRWDDKDGDYRVLEQKGEHQAPFRLGNTPDHGLVFTFTGDDSPGATAEGVLSNVEPPVGEWFHLTGVYDAVARSATLYLNGEQIGTAQLTHSAWNADAAMRLGPGMAGAVDEVKLYQRALSGADIVGLYAEPLGAAARRGSGAKEKTAPAKAATAGAVSAPGFDYEHIDLQDCKETPGDYQYRQARIQEKPYYSCWSSYLYVQDFEEDPITRTMKKSAKRSSLIKQLSKVFGSAAFEDDDMFRFRATWVIHSYLGDETGAKVVKGAGTDLLPQDMKLFTRLDEIAVTDGDGQVKLSSVDLEGLDLSLGVSVGTKKPGTNCSVRSGDAQRKDVSKWHDDPDDVFVIRAGSPSHTNATCTILPMIFVYDDPLEPMPFHLWSQYVLDENGKTVGVRRKGAGNASDPFWAPNFRCDWKAFGVSPEVNDGVPDRVGGCINTRSHRVFRMSKTRDANFIEVVQHIEDALDWNTNANTFPPMRPLYDWTNPEYPPTKKKLGNEIVKIIPGDWANNYSDPLVRRPEGQQSINRQQFSNIEMHMDVGTPEETHWVQTYGTNYCKYYFRGKYPNASDPKRLPVSAGLECDEYPFASTYQGAATANGAYSVRAVNGRQNNAQGDALKRFYADYRVGAENPFWVLIEP
ncbi:DUF4082 domain-containing protein [Sphaerisporangium sp. NPDC051017]|uniref:DUF4082 domain-containing protein n=1 Tax=Sphaerisporangium sp. NPDC051017 TaxID=3154636 RepID=UPI00343404A4